MALLMDRDGPKLETLLFPQKADVVWTKHVHAQLALRVSDFRTLCSVNPSDASSL